MGRVANNTSYEMVRALLSLLLLSCLAMMISGMPYNAVGPFYTGDMASAPSFDIKEHLWPGLTVKNFSLGGK